MNKNNFIYKKSVLFKSHPFNLFTNTCNMSKINEFLVFLKKDQKDKCAVKYGRKKKFIQENVIIYPLISLIDYLYYQFSFSVGDIRFFVQFLFPKTFSEF